MLDADFGAGGGRFETLYAAELDATSADLSTDGSGSIAATLTGGWVKLRVHGSGSIDWWGNADVLLFEDFGSGRITHHNP